MWTDELECWLAYYRKEGIEWISTGAAVVRRRPPGGRIVAYQATGGPRGNAGEQLLRISAAHDDLAAAGGGSDDAWWLDGRFRLVDHRLREDARYRDGTYTVELIGVSISGAPLNARVEPDALHALGRLDGSKLADVVERAQRETGLDRRRIEQATLTTMRRLCAAFSCGSSPVRP